MEHLVEFVIPKIKAYWEDIAYILGYEYTEVNGIEVQQSHDVNKCCRELLINWLNTSHGPYPKTWTTLLVNLRRLENLTATVEQIEQKLASTDVMYKYQDAPEFTIINFLSTLYYQLHTECYSYNTL